jgi:exodeoxyribonuclease V alpha subunit
MTVHPVSPSIADLREVGVLGPAEVHVTETITRLTGPHDPDATLAVALAVRAPRLGHVCLDLSRTLDVGLADRAEERVDVQLPDLDTWVAAIEAAPSVRRAEAAAVTPLVLDGHRLYLDRYWGYEGRLVARLAQLVATDATDRDPERVRGQLDRLFDTDPDDPQRRAAEVATRRALTVLTGGPGTGKTTTVVRLLATLWTTSMIPPRIVLAAPTGKAAARLAEAIREVAGTLPLEPPIIAALQRLPATTLHRLLGWQPRNPTRFRHDASHPLPYDVVIVDEASMTSLPLMAKLTDALADGARLVLVGDRDQLASVDAGAVLSDICGPRVAGATAADGSPPATATEGQPTATAGEPPRDGAALPLHESIVTLTRFHRFGVDSGIGAVARAIGRLGTGSVPHSGNTPAPVDEVVALLRGERTEPGGPESYDDVALRAPAPTERGIALPAGLLDEVVEGYAAAVRAALDDAPVPAILQAFDRIRVLAALRRGTDGVEGLNRAIAQRLAAIVPEYRPDTAFPIGQPVLVTRNDHASRLYNGDVGVVVRDPDEPELHRVAFLSGDGQARLVAPGRLPESEPVFAMSIHKSQGSQFDRVVVVLPRRDSPLLSRELVYTGITRAARQVTIVADEPILRAALGRQVQRASGLIERLWHTPSTSQGTP